MYSYLTQILLLLGCGLTYSSQLPPRMYFYINQKMTWDDAQKYCREHYTDLATFESYDDINMLETNILELAWIGLRDDTKSWQTAMGSDSNSWRWSATGENSKTGYQAWNTYQPDNYKGKEYCTQMLADGKWADWPCHHVMSSVCYNVTSHNKTIYTFVAALKTWSSAQEYCRNYYTDLAMIEDDAENTKVRSVIPADTLYVWIGLYRVPWTWSDMSQSTFRNWYYVSPNNFEGKEHCVKEYLQRDHTWDDQDCSSEINFICYKGTKLRTVVKTKIRTDADLTDQSVNAQILQQLGAMVRNQSWTDFTLQWKSPPKKQEKRDLSDL